MKRDFSRNSIEILVFLVFAISGITVSAQQCLPENPTLQASVGTGSLNAVAHGEGKYVAVGVDGKAIWSIDGQQWFDLPTPSVFSTWWDVEYGVSENGEGQFFMSGNANKIARVDVEDLVAGGSPQITLEGGGVTVPTAGIKYYGVAFSGSEWVAVGTRTRTIEGGDVVYDNYAVQRGCSPTTGICKWNLKESWLGFQNINDSFTGVTSGGPMCTPNTAFAALTRRGRVYLGFNSGIWTGSPLTTLSDGDFIKFTGGKYIAGGDGGDLSISDDAGHFHPGFSCTSSDPWTSAYDGASNIAWFNAEERLGVRALVGVADIGSSSFGRLGYTSTVWDMTTEADPAWTPLIQDLGPEPLNSIAGGNGGWVIVGGEGASQSIYYKSCGETPMISNIPSHTRQAGEPAVFYFSAFDEAESNLTYTVDAYSEGPDINGISVNEEQRVLGDLDTINGAFDGAVNFFDLAQMTSSFFKGSGDPDFDPYSDLTSDGIVNFFDLAVFRSNFLETFQGADPEKIVSVIEWTPPVVQIGNTVTFIVTASSPTGISEKRFSVLITAP